MKCVSGWFKAALLSASLAIGLSACAVYEPAPVYAAPGYTYYPAPTYYEPAPVYSYGFVSPRHHGRDGWHHRRHDWR